MGGFFYIAIMIAVLLTPSSLLAREDGTTSEPSPAEEETTPDPPPIPPEESGLPENCTWPGILINNSSKTMYIAFDKDDAPYEWIYRDVPPGTNSKVHTCDTDYFTYQYQNWWFADVHKLAGWWTNYIFHATWECVDHPREHHTGQCNFVEYSHNPGAD